MKLKSPNFLQFITLICLLFGVAAIQNVAAQSVPYTPAKGTPERKAILDAVRKYRKASDEVYTPRDFKVQSGWAFVSADDPQEPGVDSLGFYVLLKKTGSTWKVVDEVSMREGSDFQKEIRRLRKKYPKAPSKIYPQN